MKLKSFYILICLFIPTVLFGEEVCLKIEGCSLDNKGRCVECVWIDDNKKDKEVVLPTTTRSNRRKNREYKMTVCKSWNPITSVEPEPVCRVVSSN